MTRQSVARPGRRSALAFAGSAALMLGMLVALSGAASAVANGVPLEKGDVLAGVGNAQVKNFSPSGTLRDTLTDNSGASFTTGMCFDSAHNLYVTDFVTTMSKYSDEANLLISPFPATFATGHPESCTVDASNNIYAGGPETASIEKLNTNGELIESIPVESGGRTGGTDWVDLAANECTIYYTGEGSVIDRYNVCTHEQEAKFATGLPEPCFALRIRPNGEVMVACASEVVRLNASGEVVQTYPIPGHSELFALNLDPDGTTFWTGDINTGEIYHLNIETGAIVNEFPSSPNTQLAGLAVVGEIEVAKPEITLTPPFAENPVGATHTVTVTVTEGGKPQAGVTVTFTVTGANPQTGSATTNAGGEATFTYTGEHAGTDTIVATFVDKAGNTVESNSVSKKWIEVAKETTLTTSLSGGGQSGESITVPAGTAVTDQATLSGANAAMATGTVTYNVYSDSECTKLVSSGTVSVTAGSVLPSEPQTEYLPGTYYWTTSYTGDHNNKPSTSACGAEKETATGFGGNFVIGNEDAAVGTSVTFWGAHWWTLNSLSGGLGPASFKGFEDDPAIAACGQNWTTDPGNSIPPPTGPLPAYIPVIVSSKISKSGAAISGDTVHVVLVKINPGYAPDVGGAGTGTVVSQVC